MSKFRNTSLGLGFSVMLLAGTPVLAGDLGLGRVATPEEIAVWDIDVRPDGKGLPEGRGTVAEGEEIFIEKCAMCHGEFGEGVGRYPVLAGGQDTLDTENPVKTIGSYWPYLSAAFDYIRHAMPFGEPQSLKPDEIYAIIAYLLYLNDLMEEDGELSKENFTSFHLPNEKGFFDDPRPDTPTIAEKGEPCMKNCKQEVKIVKRARVIDVTPEGEEE